MPAMQKKKHWDVGTVTTISLIKCTASETNVLIMTQKVLPKLSFEEEKDKHMSGISNIPV